MGAKKGYHPISLHVIRGAAEFCGWQFGKIVRLKEVVDEQRAEYKCTIVRTPRGANEWAPRSFMRQLQHCFVDDIEVTQVELSTLRQPLAYLRVQLNKSPMDKMLAAASESEITE